MSSLNTSLIRSNPHFPDFIKNHPIFTKFNKIDKIFPLIGLKNCSKPISKISLIKDMSAIIKIDCIDVIKYYSTYVYSPQLKRDAKKILPIIEKLKDSDFINLKTKKARNPINLKLDSFLPEYINNIIKEYSYGIKNINNNNMEIIFASDGISGIWDIATMSERGIESCQSWSGSYRSNLVGSIVDPFVGIIYMARRGRKTTYRETEMLFRALVRYVVANKKPALLIEQIYDNGQITAPQFERAVESYFKIFLQSKIKLPVIFTKGKYHIPNSKIVAALPSCGQRDDAKDYCKSYRDSGISYSKSKSVNYSKIKPF